ncbi:MAG: DUF3288 family protein [Snowella sp.]|nr:DUF3288 family protein [Snowella sp.]
MAGQDQTHPQERKDSEIIDRLLRSQPEPRNLADLARLLIRYRGFPGARETQRNLRLVLQQWQLTEENLFEQTRQLYATGQVYQKKKGEEEQDWS